MTHHNRQRDPRTAIATLVAFVALIGVPLSTASGTGDPLSIEQAELLGKIALNGGLDVFIHEHRAQSDPTDHPEFRLTAKSLHVETDRSEVSTSFLVFDPETTNARYTDALVIGSAHRPHFEFTVWPLEPGTMIHAATSTCASVSSADRSEIQRSPHLQGSNRESNRVLVTDSVHWSDCQAGNYTMKGDFLLRLWEWDAELFTPTGTRSLESGRKGYEGVPEPVPGTNRMAGTVQEQFIYAYNATLEVPRLAGHHRIYIQDMVVSATSGVRMLGVEGDLLGLKLDHQEVFVKGADMSLRMTGNGQGIPLTLQIEGTPEQIEVDGQTKPLSSQEGSMIIDRALGIPWIPALVVAGLLVALGAITWRSSPKIQRWTLPSTGDPSDTRFDEWIEEATKCSRDRPRRACRLTRRALRIHPNHPGALSTMARAMFNRKKYAKATRYYKEAIFAEHGENRIFDNRVVASWAVGAACALARIRFTEENPTQRDRLAEQILTFARIAWHLDEAVSGDLLKEVTLGDLWESIRMIGMSRFGVST